MFVCFLVCFLFFPPSRDTTASPVVFKEENLVGIGRGRVWKDGNGEGKEGKGSVALDWAHKYILE